ncbi:cob(I)yrinic acid a,c-diamide adenosyltransferase [Oxalobacter vibrioformis]|uniref:Cobalamin adenosyltransferase n=1 Tax=Oxalobacter vibrioformis TaxID=933080 RepID=A0A9E9LVD8_9BURK|nr:cob(I)yrinic acid a,c-diamide adenosyltransferase [Oxalobacter vibrioformis]NLC24562.1 cob(I)yrinic acid a,c-diamide adenosyltransferase [Oxalobacter sp.]WAW08951.1 cob(I)yrinic acid a,c-diamide adenosyltransferase [Oxalobacter vibrioformis]
MFKKTIRIMTRMGDGGMTTLADGSRVAKSSPRIEAIGSVDELNSLIGLLLSENLSAEIESELIAIQNDLFDIGAELAGSPQKLTGEDKVVRLENQAQKYDANLLSLQGFILPGGIREGALLHYARSVCRRTERSIFVLAESENISEAIGKYLNRLSDLLFIYARVVNREAGKPDRLWQKSKNDAV